MTNEQQLTFISSDGSPLFYRYRPAKNSNKKQAIVLFHRGHEHSARMMFVCDELALDDFAYFAWDARGHGNSQGARGDSPSIGTSIADVDCFIKHIQQKHGIAPENICVIAQSVGAVLVAGWLNDYAPTIRCAILASPAFKVKLYVPLARPALRLMYQLRGNFFVNSYVKSNYLTHDLARQHDYDNDPNITRAISVRILLGLYDLSKRVIAHADAITTPIQLLISGSDFVVHHKPQHDFYNHLGSHIKERHVFPNFYHDTLGEKNREQVFEKMRQFIQQRFAEPIHIVDSTRNHLASPSKICADRLATPLSPYSPMGAYWAIQRAAIRMAARWSYGLKTGVLTGFDSGSSLDYIYKNQARGENTLGEWIDRIYLNAIGWRGIRQRKIHIEQAITLACQKLRLANKKIHILDVAAGHGRYLFDTFDKIDLPDSIRLRDYNKINVLAGKKLIAERQWQNIATFDQIDAFNRDNYKRLKPRPTLGIVSGLYELFADNDLVLQSLKGFGESIAKGGYLIYTNQPHHPQLELIARVLTSHKDGNPNWVMRLRSQQEMDQLVEAAGFKKIHQWIDNHGIFTVSLAVKGEEHIVLLNKTAKQTDLPDSEFVDSEQTVVNW